MAGNVDQMGGGIMVGARGFEPPTTATPLRRYQTALRPVSQVHRYQGPKSPETSLNSLMIFSYNSLLSSVPRFPFSSFNRLQAPPIV